MWKDKKREMRSVHTPAMRGAFLNMKVRIKSVAVGDEGVNEEVCPLTCSGSKD